MSKDTDNAPPPAADDASASVETLERMLSVIMQGGEAGSG